MFKNMTVGPKIILGFSVALILTAIIGLVSVYNLVNIGDIVNQLATQEIPETSAVVEAERAMWKTHVYSYEFDINVDEKSKKDWFDNSEKIERAVDKIIPIATALNHSETLKVASDVKQALHSYSEIGKNYTSTAFENLGIEKNMEIEAAIIEKNLNEYIEVQNGKMDKAIERSDLKDIKLRVEKLLVVNNAIDLYNIIRKNEYLYFIRNKQENADQLTKNLNKLILVSKDVLKKSLNIEDQKRMEVSINSSEQYGKLMNKWIVNKKKQLELLKQSDSAAMKIISLTSATAIQADKDAYDIGVDAVNLTSTVKTIILVLLLSAIIIGSILAFIITRGIINPLHDIIEGLNSGSDQVASASGQLSSSSQQLAEGASEQAASIEETSSSLEEMSSMTKQNAVNSGEANNLMKNANQVVKQANTSMNELTVSMNDISKASEETSKIIKTIDEIAFQTNLLALNAAVEAARAGEAGAGFAVVADEVRNLALRAADAAKNTAALIETTVKKINDGTGLVSRTSDAFGEVTKNSDKVGELVGEIAAASNEQAQGIEQINKAVNEMDKVVQGNAANAEESASASEEMNAQATQMKSMVGGLIDMVGTNGNGKNKKSYGRNNGDGHELKHLTLSNKNRNGNGRKSEVQKTEREVRPDQVIPIESSDFVEF